MFKKKEELDLANVDTVIGKETEINGKIVGKGILRIEGKVAGEITAGDIIIGETGIVEANIKARHVTISGLVKGNVDASGLLELQSSAKLIGDIKISNLSIGEGALFKGNCDMRNSEKFTDKIEKDEK